MEFQGLMRGRFEAVIDHASGRPVIRFMSGNQQHPDMMCEVFILAPTDLLDEHEMPATRTAFVASLTQTPRQPQHCNRLWRGLCSPRARSRLSREGHLL